MPSSYKLHIHRWVSNVAGSYLAVSLAQTAAVSAEMVHTLMDHVRTRRLDELLPAKPKPDEWFALYRDHKRITKAVADWSPTTFGDGSAVQAMLDNSRVFSTLARTKPDTVKDIFTSLGAIKLRRAFQQGMRIAPRLYKRHLKEMRQTLSKHDDLAEIESFDAKLKCSSEFLFYFRIVLPCVLTYREYPARIFHRARYGDVTAIEKLIRLDDMADQQPEIEHWMNRHSSGVVRLARQANVSKWKQQGLENGQFSLNQVQVSFGGLILAIFEITGRYIDFRKPGLQPPQITADNVRELFYCVQKDSDKLNGHFSLEHELMAMKPKSWQKMIGKHRDMWLKLLTDDGRLKSG